MWTKQSENNFSESEDILTRKKISKSGFILNDPNFKFHPLTVYISSWCKKMTLRQRAILGALELRISE